MNLSFGASAASQAAAVFDIGAVWVSNNVLGFQDYWGHVEVVRPQ